MLAVQQIALQEQRTTRAQLEGRIRLRQVAAESHLEVAVLVAIPLQTWSSDRSLRQIPVQVHAPYFVDKPLPLPNPILYLGIRCVLVKLME